MTSPRGFVFFARLIVIALCALAGAGCALDPYELEWELHVPKSNTPDATTCFELTTDDSAFSTHLTDTTRVDDTEFSTFKGDCLIFGNWETRRAVMIARHGRPAQVFVLPIPANPKVADWTDWMRPTYLEEETKQHDAQWTFMNEIDVPRSTTIPSDCFQLRYRIAKWIDPTTSK